MVRIVKVPKFDKEKAEKIFSAFRVSASLVPDDTNDRVIKYQVTGLPNLVTGFFDNAVTKDNFIDINAYPRFV